MIINRTHGGNASGNILGIAIGIAILALLLVGTAQAQVIIPYLDTGYKYKVVAFDEGAGFEQPGFDDSGFSVGDASFGTRSCSLNAKTYWSPNTDILLRKEFNLSSGATNLKVSVVIDNDIQVFINGHDISGGLQVREGCAVQDSFIFNASDDILKTGDNLLAVRGRDRGEINYVDVQVSADIPTPTTPPESTFNISGFKVNNTNGSGIQGWNITLMNSTMQKSMMTGVDGSYKFTNLVNGTYSVTEEMQAGWTNVSPMSQQITINGADMPNINFTNQPPTPTPTIPIPVPVPTPPAPTTVSITAIPDIHYTIVGKTITFKANPIGSWGNNIQYKWSIANDNKTPACPGDSTATGQSISVSPVCTGSITLSVTATDEIGNVAFSSYLLKVNENNPIPVILVHGWMELKDSKTDKWAETMKTRFENAGFNVEIFNYEGKYQNITKSAGKLAKMIEVVKKNYSSAKVDIVGHSEGGLVARYYINSNSNDSVRKLVMIGSPNHGTDWRWFGEAASQMSSHSPFLIELNGNDNCVDLQHRSDKGDKFNQNVTYYTIASHWRLTYTHYHKKVSNREIPIPNAIIDGDGLTADNSLRVTGQLNYDDIISNVLHGQEQVNSEEIIDRAIYRILENTPRSEANVALNSEQTLNNEQTLEDVAVQLSPPIQSTIKPNEVKTHIVFIDNTTKKAGFNLFWPGSDLDLVLYTPSGGKINSSVASNNSNINYTSGAMFESYEVRFPEKGNWRMEITAVNVTNSGENYSAITFMETNLFVGAGTNKNSYAPNEQITVVAYVQDNGTPLSKVNVNASISRPDGTNSTIQLYDDGLHNDNQTNDGIYANVYTNTNVSGVYYITTSANGMIRNDSFERTAFNNAWVELYPDLTITSSDINFSNDIPIPGENITINATIHNIGDADANNTSILFYDGDPASGVLIAEDIVNVSAGQTARASSSWNTTAGQHEIYVLISPFNEFLEKNYTNNKASKIINVAPTLPVRFTTDKAIYSQGEQVIFALINNGTDVIDLPNLAPWWVDNATTGERIFSPIAAQVITQLDPGKSESWIWDQNDSEGRQVQPGTYRGGISSIIGVNYTKEFEIATAPLITPTPTVTTPAGTCLGDITGDSNVNSDDFVLFAIAYDSASGDLKYNVKADMNNNGVINSDDFVLFASVYGKAC